MHYDVGFCVTCISNIVELLDQEEILPKKLYRHFNLPFQRNKKNVEQNFVAEAL